MWTNKKIHRPSQAKKGLITAGTTLRDQMGKILSKPKFQQAGIVKTNCRSNPLADEDESKMKKSNTFTLITGAEWKIPVKGTFCIGFARTWSIRGGNRFTEEQKEFMQWAFNQGVKDKNKKLTAHIAAELMRIIGTSEGEKRYPDDLYFKKSADGKPRFKRKDRVLHYEIKAFFGRAKSLCQKMDLEKKRGMEMKMRQSIPANDRAYTDPLELDEAKMQQIQKLLEEK